MQLALSLSESQTFEALRAFLLAVLPTGTPVVRALTNRVPEPKETDFVVMSSIARKRLATNVGTYADVFFIGSIAGDVLTVTTVDYGTLAVGRQVFGAGIAADTRIAALLSASGGTGTYRLSNTQAIASEAMAAGVVDLLQPTQLTMQLDVHGPESAAHAQVISTLFRDEYAVSKFEESGFAVVPLHADDPRLTPFVNAEQQVEMRWVITAELQCNPSVTLPQQFASELSQDLVNVDVVYPPVA